MNDEHVPTPDFTPATLGKTLGEDAVLEWLLRTADNLGTKAELSRAVQANGLTHIEDAKSRRDMASGVIQGPPIQARRLQ
ncbi:MAG: hypothetical protein IPN77_18875 [Sandaracinaceae bacterium]|nr:hypothetical protein [Sandaracinaceae bacterium]